MGKCRFESSAVTHDRICQIGKVLFPEERKRYLSQLLGKSYTPHAAFHICSKICGVVLKICHDKYERKADKRANSVKDYPAAGYAAVHHVDDEII